MTKKKKLLHIFLGLGVTIACFWFAVPGSGLEQKWQGVKQTAAILRTAEYWWLIPLLGLLALFFLTKAYRWAILLAPIRRFNTSAVLPATMIGFMSNNILPAHLGEFVRMYVLSRTYTLSKTSVLSTIVLERELDAIAITIIFTAIAWFLKLTAIYKLGGVIGASVVVFVLLCLMYYVHRTDTVLRLWERWFRFLPDRLHARLGRMIHTGSLGLEVLRNPVLVFYVIAVSIVHWSLLALYMYLVFLAFSIHLPFAAAFLLLCVAMVGVLLPAAPGYWGVIQAVFTFTLTPMGVAQPSALAASVYYLASQYAPTTLTGLIYMGRMGFRLDELKAHADSREIEGP